MVLDKDLNALQEARNMIKLAQVAQKSYGASNQDVMDRLITAIATKLSGHAQELARMAVEETGFGRYEDKITKNLFATVAVYNYIKDQKLIGILEEDKVKKTISVGVPVGVIAALVPSTNPTSTVIYKSLISLKTGNAVIFSPHPSALRSITYTVQLIKEVLVQQGFSGDLVAVLSAATLEGTSELMKRSNLILATGGPAMVKAAYSSGTPALGVGAGNVPAFIERSANIKHAVECIIASKTFDYGTICASEQMIVTEQCIADDVEKELKRQGGYFLNSDEQKKMESIILGPTRALNAKIVGKSAEALAKMAGITVPANTKVIIGRTEGVGKNHPFSVEKLSPLLGYYVEKDWEAACQRCIEILEFEGIGHSLAMHTTNEALIKEFALKKPVSRLLINTPSALGGVGVTTGLAPAFTLGCGAVGGSSISANVEAHHLTNVRKVAYETTPMANVNFSMTGATALQTNQTTESRSLELDIEKITKMVIDQLGKR